ncbi:MAG: hypothetical protein ABI681_06445, partial [Gemmatimonadales bacterium]
MNAFRARSTVVGLTLKLTAVSAGDVEGQAQAVNATPDSVLIRAHAEYAAGSLHRFLLGDNYRDLWTTPIKVPLLDLRSYAGGIRPTKTGGGRQTINLRFESADSTEFVFRPVYKPLANFPDPFKGTIIWNIVLDARSGLHPLAPLVVPPVLSAIGALHPRPQLFVMPDDTLLGNFRKDFAGALGTLEEVPNAPSHGGPFAGADTIIDSDELLERIDRSPGQRVGTHGLLAVRMVDMLLGDNDRHAGQWKWARLEPGGDWAPIPRDRDNVFVSYEGFLPKLSRMVSSRLVTFDSGYAKGAALFHKRSNSTGECLAEST